jgi:hypothetical protein
LKPLDEGIYIEDFLFTPAFEIVVKGFIYVIGLTPDV